MVFGNIMDRLRYSEELLPTELPLGQHDERALLGIVTTIAKYLVGNPSENEFNRIIKQQNHLTNIVGKDRSRHVRPEERSCAIC